MFLYVVMYVSIILHITEAVFISQGIRGSPGLPGPRGKPGPQVSPVDIFHHLQYWELVPAEVKKTIFSLGVKCGISGIQIYTLQL